MKTNKNLHNSSTPLSSHPPKITKKPSIVINLREKLTTPQTRVSVLSKFRKSPYENTENHFKTEDKPEKLPKIPPIHKKGLKSDVRHHNYSKWVPKFHSYKPIFQERNRSHNYSRDEDEEYILLKNKLRWIDY